MVLGPHSAFPCRVLQSMPELRDLSGSFSRPVMQRGHLCFALLRMSLARLLSAMVRCYNS